MKRYDFHSHTYYSPCGSISPGLVLRLAKKRKLNGIAVTDHHTIKGALEVRKLNKDKNFEVIIGEEITTEYGDILGLYLKKEVKSRKLFNVIKEIKKQKGIIIVPHPFRIVPWLKFKYPLGKLKGKIDAIETFNSRNLVYSNNASKRTARKYNFPEVGSSDAHIPLDVGRGYTLFEGDLRKALKERKTTAKGSTLFGLFSGGMAFLNKRILSPLGIKKCP